MATETTTEVAVAEVEALLEKASRTASEAADSFNRIDELLSDIVENWSLQDARALVGQAYLARRWAVWAVEECDKSLGHLGDQVCFAEERATFARIDAERGTADAS